MEVSISDFLNTNKDRQPEKLYVILRQNLHRAKNKTFDQINMEDVPLREQFKECSMAIFVDNDGDTKILKNKYGTQGIVISNENYSQYKRLIQESIWLKTAVTEKEHQIKMLQNENYSLNNPSKKESFMARLFGNAWPFN